MNFYIELTSECPLGHYEIAKLLKQHHNFVADPNMIGTEVLEVPKPEPSEIGAFAIVFNTSPEELEEAIQSGEVFLCSFALNNNKSCSMRVPLKFKLKF